MPPQPVGAKLRLGGGLVEVPPVPQIDPASAVMGDPTVPERKRFCWKCNEPVGRKSASTKATQHGTCPKCGSTFDFRPLLEEGNWCPVNTRFKGPSRTAAWDGSTSRSIAMSATGG
ncbi:serine/threonine protein kinase [Rhodococcus sp. 3Y1]